MELFRNLFEGYPNLWGGGVAHSVLILSLVIAFGIMLGKIKVAGISLGVTWILFVGIVFGHFNLNLDEHLLHFLKEFGRASADGENRGGSRFYADAQCG